MEILNQVTLAGNLTDKPSVDDAGGRVFVRARLAQNWFYDTHGKTVEHHYRLQDGRSVPYGFLVHAYL